MILTGVRDDIGLGTPGQIAKDDEVTVERVIGLLPKLRSRLTRETDSNASWGDVVVNHFGEMAPQVRAIYGQVRLHQVLPEALVDIKRGLGTGDYQLNKMGPGNEDPDLLNGWYHDPHLTVWLNHDARGHMRTDLRRYAYAAAFADAFGWSQKGHGEFSLQGLRPNHVNWETGKFSDRFRVQLRDRPATTVTSHISKDGHYFIYYDPKQCRSLTVRGASRLQTLPDNYFFQGNRTQQFHQVGNAVSPLLAKKIGGIAIALLRGADAGTAEPAQHELWEHKGRHKSTE